MSGVTTNPADVEVDVSTLFSALRRNAIGIIAFTLICTGAAFLLVNMATPKYEAETRVLIETRESVFTRPEQQGENREPILDNEGVVSQVEVIRSSDLLTKVAKQLDLANREEFDPAKDIGFIEQWLILFGLRPDPALISPEERVLDRFREKLDVYRVEESRVIVIHFQSEDPELAAAVPDAIAEAYLEIQREAKQASNADATEWLEPEIADLREKVKQAEARVAEYRATSDLLIGQNETVLATQQLSELSSELSRVRANRASAEARAASVANALRDGGSLESIPEVLSSALIQRLREREVELRAEIAELSTTLLDQHPQLKSLRSQVADLERQVRSEAVKIQQGLVSEAQTARLREQELLRDLNELKSESARAGEQEVELRSLEREAAAQRELLESYLTRYREAASRKERNYLPADARVFARAVMPTKPSSPKKLAIIGAAFAGSLLLSIIAVLLKELFSGRAMRPAYAMRYEAPSLAPDMDDLTADLSPAASAAQAAARGDGHAPARKPGIMAARQERAARIDGDWFRSAAEEIVAASMRRVVAVSPEGEVGAAGSIALARAIADTGLRTLVVDLSGTGAVSRVMRDSEADKGITDILCGEAQFSDIIHGDLYSECHIVPSGVANAARAARRIGGLPTILNALNTAYEIVVVECGTTDAAGIDALVVEDTVLVVNALDTMSDSVLQAVAELDQEGYGEPLIVSLDRRTRSAA